ncbi:MAG: hypothetical protein FJ297_12190 [Planctomycetes bacterium]|nr:hypothetical protein [Planctomycetota bacterium]
MATTLDSISLIARPLAPDPERAARADALRRIVGRVMANATPSRVYAERRSDRRFPFAVPLLLTPLDAHGGRRDGDAVSVIGRHLSDGGLDFYHNAPIPSRYMIAWLPVEGERSVGVVLELTWCRFSGLGWYENGGKFVAPPRRMTVDLEWRPRY